MKIGKYKNFSGISLVESIISISMMLFTLTSLLYVISSSITTSTLADKKASLSSILDDRVDQYAILYTFDTSPSGSIIFSEAQDQNDPDIMIFTARDTDFDISMTREAKNLN